jgi:pimeloyl-ACP methyl ester carboxylesterase
MSVQPARPVYLETVPDSVFGFFHPAEGHETGVLLLPPFGWDEVCSYRSRRLWAERLAGDGHPVLRMDLPGAGDSAGSPRDPGRVAAWRDAVAGAAGWLRGRSGCTRVAAIGVGVGGFAAYLAAAAGAPIEDLVLWGVPARGKTLLRELRAFAGLKAAEFPDPDAVEPPPLPDGYLEVAGYLVTDETAGALQEADLTAMAPGVERVLLLDRDGMKPDGRLLEHLEASGAAVTVARGPGYGDMQGNPQEVRPPRAVFDTVEAWLASAAPTPPREVPPAPQAHEALQLPGFREAPITVDQPYGEMFAILSEPVGGARGDTALVLVNAGAVRRIGPNRMWVEAARRWAARGVPVLRLDIEGLGDSDGDPTRFEDTRELYSADLALQVSAALDELEARGVASRFVVAGLCAGAFWAFHALHDDDRVAAACMVNLWAFFWDDSMPAAGEARRLRKLARPHGWFRLMRGHVSMRQIRLVLKWLLRTPIEFRERRERRRAIADRLDNAFDHLRDAGKHAVFVFGRGEPVYDDLEREGRLDRRDRWPNIEVRPIPARDHTFRALWLQERVHEAIDHTVETQLRQTPAWAPASAEPAAG